MSLAFAVSAILCAAAPACWNSHGQQTQSGTDADGDGDTDVDTDVDSDTDSDTDTDTDTDSDSDSECDGTTYFDAESGQWVACHPVTGLVWLRCPIGQVWSVSATACEGELSLLTFLEAEDACPVGFVWPSDDDMSTVLCNFSEEMIPECPEDHFDSCAECSICDLMFPGDTGYYPSSDAHQEGDAYIVRVFNFETGCSTEDVDIGGTTIPYNVRCVRSPSEMDAGPDSGK